MGIVNFSCLQISRLVLSSRPHTTAPPPHVIMYCPARGLWQPTDAPPRHLYPHRPLPRYSFLNQDVGSEVPDRLNRRRSKPIRLPVPPPLNKIKEHPKMFPNRKMFAISIKSIGPMIQQKQNVWILQKVRDVVGAKDCQFL